MLFVLWVLVLLQVQCLALAQDPGSSPNRATGSAHEPPRLPPLPPGVHALKFSDIFRAPVGPRGLEFTDEVQRLDGQKVRILGLMVRQTEPWTNAFLLAPVHVQLHEHEYGMADDLPASTIYVHLPETSQAPVPYTPGPMLITGTLRLGAREIESGRRMWITLDMEPPAKRGVTDSSAAPASASGTPRSTSAETRPKPGERKPPNGNSHSHPH
jgi:hypothetical protein